MTEVTFTRSGRNLDEDYEVRAVGSVGPAFSQHGEIFQDVDILEVYLDGVRLPLGKLWPSLRNDIYDHLVDRARLDEEVESDPDRYYDEKLEFDL